MSPPPRAPKGPSKLGIAVRLVAFTCLCAVVCAVAFVIDCAYEIPIDGGISGSPTESGLLITAADGTELATRGTVHGAVLAPEEISETLKKAIVAIEDRRFYEHGALDLHGMGRAFVRDALQHRAREGASTITQQLARLMLLSPERTLRRKVQEAIIAFWLEHHLTKAQILARYLDTAYFGAGAYGADAAAQRYFGKSAHDLAVPEAAMIAGLVRAPSQLAPHRNLQAAQARARLVVQAMAATGAITREQGAEAIAHPAKLKVAPETPSGPGYVADLAAADVKGLVGDAALDLATRTTVDPALQSAAEAAVEQVLGAEGNAKHASQAAVVALGPDGAILALVGGRDYDVSIFDRATQAKRQPGSLFKLFVYYAALQRGMTPDSRVVDRPVQVGNWEPHNFENRYRGPMTLADAFAHSVNTVAVELSQQVGIPTVVKTAYDLGVTSKLPEVPSLALGSADVDLMEMTHAFATVASDQDTIEPYLVQRITSRNKVLFNRPPRYAQTTDPSPQRVAMRELLADVVRKGTGRGAQAPFPTGGKTGTTQDFRDAWFIGSAPDVTVGVWVGNDDNSPMNGVVGGDLPVKIWRTFVVAAEAAMNRKAHPPTRVATPGAPPESDEEPQTLATAFPANPVKPVPGTIAGQFGRDAEVVDTSTLEVGGHQIRLQGVAPLGGGPARALARYLRRREVSCAPSGSAYRCSVDGDDLAMTILSNGGGDATSDAPPDLVAARDGARAGRAGIWRYRR